jgi:hypothetical protein
MSQGNQGRGRFSGRGRSGSRDGGRFGQRYAGRYETAQDGRNPHKSSDDDENFTFDIQPNKVDTVKFVTAQRKLISYISTRYPDVGKIFSHGYEVEHTYPIRPEPVLGQGQDVYDFERDIYREKVKLVMRREEEYLYNKKLAYGVLWKHCSLALQNSIRGTLDYTDMSENENALELWEHVKRLCTVGVVINADPEKVQRDADLRFNSISQLPSESVSGFYDRYLQEVNAWVEAGNAFVDTEIIVEGDDPDAEIDEQDARVRAIRARVHLKSEKRKARNFMSKLDRSRFTGMEDELANDLVKGRDNYPYNIVDAMQLAQSYRYDGRAMGDVITNTRHVEGSAYVTQKHKSKNKTYKRKVEDEGNNEAEKKDYSHIKCNLCDQYGHYKSKCPMLGDAKDLNDKSKKQKSESDQKQATVTKGNKKKADTVVFVSMNRTCR